ncbi:subunit 17 of mediator complex-domain-containing protein [Ampelomyces quisqualis]|uniref:Mediator of RNA polymerase II transcription subunit 17 n=1 Tax=Ampelomyces quisqualis TaxID=50730 RepID=A0A6A5R576_AMPQU|nr:subunit 17 of mediator complex-domain-containing protein [Ampelomyces quisqualis]
MSGAGSLMNITLRPWPAPKKEELGPQHLLQQVEQLANERGHLRNVTEKSLQDEITSGKDVSEGAKDESDEKKEKKEVYSKEERLQDVFRMQQEMSNHMEWAKFAANNAVDLISLALSSDPNKRSLASFSHTFRVEGLTQGLPFGSFGISKENHDQHVRKPDELQSLQEYEQRQELVSKGARMEALDVATDEILKAAKKLEREVRRETKYWQEIVSISDKGWPIQRVRQNARNIPFAVRYGLPEASNHFKARGLAPLRMDKDGSIILDPTLALKPKTLRVRVREYGKITGTSSLAIESGMNSTAIEKTIQLARDSLFEEELYHEMRLEARHLLPYGVFYRDSVIHVEASGVDSRHRSKMLLIDCIPREDDSQSKQSHSNDWLARNVAEGLRLLLAHEHSMRLHRRSQLPPPLTGQQQEHPSPSLLRTLLAVFRHLEGVDSLYDYLEKTSKTLESAGINVQLDTTRELSWANLAESLQSSSKKGVSATDQLLELFLKPFGGRATLTLTSSNVRQPEALSVSTRTVIGPPTFGREHRLILPSSVATELGLFQQSKFTSVEETTSYLDSILSLHIAHRQLKTEFFSRAVIKGSDARITIRTKDAKKEPTGEQDIMVRLQQGELEVTAISAANIQEEELDTEQSYTWTDRKGEMPLVDKVKSWVG